MAVSSILSGSNQRSFSPCNFDFVEGEENKEEKKTWSWVNKMIQDNFKMQQHESLVHAEKIQRLMLGMKAKWNEQH